MKRTYDYDTTIEVDIEDIIDNMTEGEVIELFESRLGKGHTVETWRHVYHMRRTLSDEAFLSYIDKVIMDATGRIL